jgi:hypothetical protein
LRPVFVELAGLSSEDDGEAEHPQIPTPADGQRHAVTVKRLLSRLE